MGLPTKATTTLRAPSPMLAISHISKRFAGKCVLNDVSLQVSSGVTRALIGSSGSGKSTLLRIVLGLVPMDAGSVAIDGQALQSFSRDVWAGRMGYVPQDGGLFPHLTAGKNVTLMARVRGWDQARIAARMQQLGELVSLDPQILRRYPHEMSGGQRQRISIMRAAFLDPPVMLLDEPMSALDPIVRSSIQSELKDIFERLGKTVVIVTHDLGEAAYLAEAMTLMHEGRVLQTGTLQQIQEAPEDPFVRQFIRAQRPIGDAGSEAEP